MWKGRSVRSSRRNVRFGAVAGTGTGAYRRGIDDPRLRTLARYWSIYEAEPAGVPELVAACFTADAIFESAALSAPLVGTDAIAARVMAIRDAARRAHVTRGPVQWAHDTVRWCWSWSGPAGDAVGTDVARFAADGRIELLVVFPGDRPE